MNTMPRTYRTPQITRQGSAIAKTEATNTGSCHDGATHTKEYDECPCSGTGSGCKAEATLE